MTIVPIYAALLALLYIYLSFRVIGVRRDRKIGIGTQGDAKLERAVRVHSNFAEYAPFGLLLLFMLETNGGYEWLVHTLCLALVAGRASHAYGMSHEAENLRFRQIGMVTTFAVIAITALALLGLAVLARV